MKLSHRIVLMVLATVIVTVYGCTESFEEEQDVPSGFAGGTVFLPDAKGAVVEIVVDMEEAWTLSEDIPWVDVFPQSGDAGTVTFNMRVLESNVSVRERVCHIDVVQSGEPMRWYLVQCGAEGLELIASEYTMDDPGGGSLRMEVLANAEFTVSCDVDWAEVSGVSYHQDSTLLEDNATYSALQTAYIDVSVSENDGAGQRTATFALTCGDNDYVVTLTQSSDLTGEVDWTKEFYRKSLGLKFTGQSCANCPRMTENFHKAAEERQGRFEILNVHSFSSNDELYYDAQKLVSHYIPGSYPSGIFNSMVRLPNVGDLYDRVVRLIDEAVVTYPSKTAISMKSSFEDNVLNLDGYIATRENLDYKIHIFVLQNDIIAEQAGAGEDYEHDAVLRYAVTDDLGDVLPGTGEQEVVHFTREVQLPSDVFYGGESDNAYLLIYTTYDSQRSPSGSVPDVTYTNFGMVVDNVISLPLNGSVMFGYEQ